LQVKDVIKGLHYLHSHNVIHGDLQCNNVLVNDAGHAVLADFGRAKVIGIVGYSTPMLAGSAPYMAPELFPSGDANTDELFSTMSDVYAFGMLCYEVFTNQQPFACYTANLDWQIVPLIRAGRKPTRPRQPQRHIPDNMWVIMEACWMTAPDIRPTAEWVAQQRMH